MVCPSLVRPVYAASPAEASRVMTLLLWRLHAFMVAQGEGFGMNDQRLSFKEMCARFDVTPRTLRYYEYIELLQPDREGRSRWYGPKEVARMTLILRGRKFGFQLEDIRQWLLIYEKDGTEAQMRAWIALADRQLGELAEQRKQLDQAIDELQKLRDDTAASLNS
jgi:DNA-binding transcriptional MerR regulator